ncbi:MAG: hypothetical protein JXO51_11505 [Candidatus Aminicenantes bacterium]|nr:hypothetical protein [Candidatus Aminicenantes bacterium]
MKPLRFFLAFCILGAAVAPLWVDGIDLVAMKKREEERRKKAAKSKIVVNDANVATISVGGTKYAFSQLEAEEPAEGKEEALPEERAKKADETRTPEFWKQQQNDLEERIAKLREDIENSQSELNKLWSDFYARNIAAEQQAIRAQIAQLTNQIEQKKIFLSETEAQLEALFEKARKAGIPPGWLR